MGGHSRRLLVTLLALPGVWGCERGGEQPASAELPPLPASFAAETLASLRPLLDSARSLYNAAEYDEARALWEAMLESARARGDSAGEAESLTWLGYTAWKLADYEEARRLGEEALDLKLRYGLKEQLARSYNALGLVADYQGRLQDAVQLYQKAVQAAQAVGGDSAVIAAASANLALIHTQLGNFEEARLGFELLRDVGRATGDPKFEANGLTNLGMLDVVMGDPHSAVRRLVEALELYRAKGLVAQEQNALGQLAAAYADLGEPRLAFAALDTALQLSRETGQRDEEAFSLEQIALLHHDAGNLKHALDLYERAREIYEEIGLLTETGTALRSVADIHTALGSFDGARMDVRRALQLHREVGDRFEEFNDLLLLAEIEHRAGNARQAEEILRAARAVTGELDAPSISLALALEEARVADRDRDSRRVIGVLLAVEAEFEQAGPSLQAEAFTLRARAHARLGELELAAAAGRRAVAAVEQVRWKFGSGMLRTTYLTGRVSAYGELVSALLKLSAIDQAFSIADAARGRALVGHLSAAHGLAGTGDSAAQSFAEAERLLRQIDELATTLAEWESYPAEERDPAVETELDERLRRMRARYQALVVAAEERDAQSAALLGTGRARLKDVQRVLGVREALVEYLVTPERTWIIVVRRDGARALASDIAQDRLASRVRVVRGAIANPKMPLPMLNVVLEGLHAVLIGPALASGSLSHVERLIVVPHTVLNYLPFAALRDEVTGNYLVEDYELQFLPTAAALPVLRGQHPVGGADLRQQPATLFAPLASSLPATRDETRTIRKVLVRANEYVNSRGTERRFRQALGRGDLVHAATHGILNVRNPMFSRIELARGSNDGSTDDGRLEVHEVLALSIRSPLVFLSGCETGVGAAGWTQFATGEDYATLAQAFLYAGAANVVATLWRIEDEGAAEFAAQFYRFLQEVSATSALARAQRALMRNPDYAAPYYWAGYGVNVGRGLAR